MRLALLPTDWMIWTLVLVLMLMILRSRGQAMLWQNWQKVFMQPSAMVSGVLLAFFVGIALLDSLRWIDAETPGSNALSVLDRGIAPLVQARERRYSAPLGLS